MEPASFPQFSQLPPEVQTIIANQSQSPISVSRLDTYRVRNVMPSVISTSYMDKPISEGELCRFLDEVWDGKIKYELLFFYLIYLDNGAFEVTTLATESLENMPAHVTAGITIQKPILHEQKLAIKTRNNKGANKIHVENVSYSAPNYDFERKGILLESLLSKSRINLGAGAVREFGSDSTYSTAELDFAAQYKIYCRRISCMKLDPQYAKKKIVAVITKLSNDAISGDFIKILFTYNRLYTEATFVNAFSDTEYIRLRVGDRIFTSEGIDLQNGNLDMKAKLLQDIKLLTELLRNYYSSLQQ